VRSFGGFGPARQSLLKCEIGVAHFEDYIADAIAVALDVLGCRM
jgi:hypothetical protein